MKMAECAGADPVGSVMRLFLIRSTIHTKPARNQDNRHVLSSESSYAWGLHDVCKVFKHWLLFLVSQQSSIEEDMYRLQQL